jgi:hypothetical protein
VPKKGNKGTIYFAVVNHSEENIDILAVNQLNIPISLEVPEQLAFIRTNFLAIINQYDINLAGLRVAEIVAGSPIVFRAHIEGVLQELFANSSIEKYLLLNLTNMARALEEHVTDVKNSIKEKNNNLLGIDEWSSYCVEERECIFSALTMIVGGHK